MLEKFTFPEKLQRSITMYPYFCLNSNQEIRRFSCVMCNDILVKPQQTICGCRMCSMCLTSHFVNKEIFCPGCKTELSNSSEFIYDRAIERELFELDVLCVNKDCEYYCKLKYLDDHLMNCEFGEEICSLCLTSYPSNRRNEHVNVNCGMITVCCEDCRQELTKKVFEDEHRNLRGDGDRLCDSWRGICPYNCCQAIQASVKVHLSVCPRVLVECGMSIIGCRMMMPRIEVEDHMGLHIGEHMTMMMGELRALHEEHASVESLLDEKNVARSNDVEELKTVLKNTTEKVVELSKELISLEGKLSIGKKDTDIKNDCGEYKWRVEDISKKIMDAKIRNITAIVSEPFYTGRPGYKLCLKMYPNGNGAGLGNSISLYFTLMKGQYDAELPWPFRRIISLSLTNTEGSNTGTMNMKPDHNPLCYERPLMESNLPAGQPKYICHDDMANLKEFIEDGSITVHARIV